ncbi:uncharacterized protein Z518_00352 [Rhinocladiella mackenziei CBS 650.93]|uniref:Uncharacterized protein n=1 Tax=Rhinocladiella mackenziei CBS 650.93 TaxID=1442369 RepID=A0A0D2HEZ9_9EURO|nr:uncharacterized protein Z518_00352 [Rhinocladiella mackenziei CBS 650.93]KIX09273.1 hypothetical protein Z518_00352 [Rhinocladiella mackenziei CBS 650.93]
MVAIHNRDLKPQDQRLKIAPRNESDNDANSDTDNDGDDDGDAAPIEEPRSDIIRPGKDAPLTEGDLPNYTTSAPFPVGLDTYVNGR